jgi:aspartate racemase
MRQTLHERSLMSMGEFTLRTGEPLMARHIGIVAVSAEGAALCYRTLCVEGAAAFGRHAHPEVSMHTHPLAEYMRHIEVGRWRDVGAMLLSSAGKLERAGADLLICPDNTVHQGLDLVRAESRLPWLHIAEEVGNVAAQRGFRRLLVLGTKYLMEGPVYPGKLEPRGIQVDIPPAETRARIDGHIFDELVYGRLNDSTREFFCETIDQGRRRGNDAVVLGCTEIPLLVDDRVSPLPTLDSTRILARAALREALRQVHDVGASGHR